MEKNKAETPKINNNIIEIQKPLTIAEFIKTN